MDTTTNWYRSLMDKINEKAEAWNLDEQQTAELRDWVTIECSEQFKAGNRDGASWAFDQARLKIAKGETL